MRAKNSRHPLPKSHTTRRGGSPTLLCRNCPANGPIGKAPPTTIGWPISAQHFIRSTRRNSFPTTCSRNRCRNVMRRPSSWQDTYSRRNRMEWFTTVSGALHLGAWRASVPPSCTIRAKTSGLKSHSPQQQPATSMKWIQFPNSPKAADARPQTTKELAISSRGVLDSAVVLGEFLESSASKRLQHSLVTQLVSRGKPNLLNNPKVSSPQSLGTGRGASATLVSFRRKIGLRWPLLLIAAR
jgi:hypothetical protein